MFFTLVRKNNVRDCISMFPIAFGIVRDVGPSQKLAIVVDIFTSIFAAEVVVGLGIDGSTRQNRG